MHTSDKPLSYNELLKKLARFDVQITERKNKCFLFYPNINGRPAIYTLHKTHHSGDEFSRPIIAAVRRRFNISLEDFYKE